MALWKFWHFKRVSKIFQNQFELVAWNLASWLGSKADILKFGYESIFKIMTFRMFNVPIYTLLLANENPNPILRTPKME